MTEKRRERKPVSQAIARTAKVIKLSVPTYFAFLASAESPLFPDVLLPDPLLDLEELFLLEEATELPPPAGPAISRFLYLQSSNSKCQGVKRI